MCGLCVVYGGQQLSRKLLLSWDLRWGEVSIIRRAVAEQGQRRPRWSHHSVPSNAQDSPHSKREDLAPDVHVAEMEKTWIPVREGQRERRGVKL